VPPLLSPKSTLPILPCAPLPSIRKVAGISNHRLFPRRAPLEGGEPSH
jgi:hypothetical protein